MKVVASNFLFLASFFLYSLLDDKSSVKCKRNSTKATKAELFDEDEPLDDYPSNYTLKKFNLSETDFNMTDDYEDVDIEDIKNFDIYGEEDSMTDIDFTDPKNAQIGMGLGLNLNAKPNAGSVNKTVSYTDAEAQIVACLNLMRSKLHFDGMLFRKLSKRLDKVFKDSVTKLHLLMIMNCHDNIKVNRAHKLSLKNYKHIDPLTKSNKKLLNFKTWKNMIFNKTQAATFFDLIKRLEQRFEKLSQQDQAKIINDQKGSLVEFLDYEKILEQEHIKNATVGKKSGKEIIDGYNKEERVFAEVMEEYKEEINDFQTYSKKENEKIQEEISMLQQNQVLKQAQDKEDEELDREEEELERQEAQKQLEANKTSQNPTTQEKKSDL